MKFDAHIECIRENVDEFADKHVFQANEWVYFTDLLNALTNLEHAHKMRLEGENNEHTGAGNTD